MPNSNSFLPEDYLAQKAERRTNLISLVLFAVVMLGVFLAFIVTNQKWSNVKQNQMAINARYQQAAEQITELTELEEQKEQMLEKAELATALVERVPRSILLAELINRMPDRLSLLQFTLTSEKIKAPVSRAVDTADSQRLGPARAKTREEAAEAGQKKAHAPRYSVRITLVGVAPTDLEVSRYLAELNAYPLLRQVTLEYTEEKEIEGQIMRKFEIKMKLDPDADMREVEPLIVPRDIRDPMSDTLRYNVGGRGDAVQVHDDHGREGH
jgi:Tfp pilus assembly protein PilN